MSVFPPFRVAFLMEGDASFDAPVLVATLNDVLGPAGLAFARAESRAGLLVSAGRLHLMLDGQERPLPAARLAGARGSGLGAILGEDWEPAIAAHRGALTLAVGPGPAPDAVQELAPRQDQELTDLMLTVAHVAASHLAAETGPLALHWGQSDQLFLPGRFLAMADMLFPLPVFLHPRPTASGRTDGHAACVGFDLIGAETLLGRPLRFAEAPARLDWLVLRAYALVAHLRAAGEWPAEGDSFGTAPGERITVTHAADGGLVLTLTEREGELVLQPRAA
jgi:hypothetical protein